MPRATRIEPSDRLGAWPPSDSAHCSTSASRSWAGVIQWSSSASLPINASRLSSGPPDASPMRPSSRPALWNGRRSYCVGVWGSMVRPESEAGSGLRGSVSYGDDVHRRAERFLDRGQELLVLDRVAVVPDLVHPAAVAGEDDRQLREVDAGRLLQVLGQRLGAAGAEDRVPGQPDLVEDLADLGEP